MCVDFKNEKRWIHKWQTDPLPLSDMKPTQNSTIVAFEESNKKETIDYIKSDSLQIKPDIDALF